MSAAGALRDVVEQDREVGRAVDLLVVADDPAPARPVVVRVDRQQRVGAELGRPLGQLDRVAGVVGADAGDDRAVGWPVASRGPRARSSRGAPRRRASRPRRSSRRPRAPSEPCSNRWCMQPRGGAASSTRPCGVERGDHRGQDRAELEVHAQPIISERSAGEARALRFARLRLRGGVWRVRRGSGEPAGCETTCVTGASVRRRIRSGRPAGSHFEVLSGSVETMISSYCRGFQISLDRDARIGRADDPGDIEAGRPHVLDRLAEPLLARHVVVAVRGARNDQGEPHRSLRRTRPQRLDELVRGGGLVGHDDRILHPRPPFNG